MVDELNSPSPTKKKSPTLSSSGVKKKKKDVEVEVEEPPPLRSVHSPNLTSLPLANYSQDMELQAQKVCSSYDEFDYDDDDDDDASGGSCSDYQLLSENEKYLLEESDQDEESGDESDDDMKIETDNTSESEDEDDDEEEEDGEEVEEEEKEEDPENPDEEKETKPENDDKREENFLKDYCYNFYKLKNLKEAEKLLSEKQHLIHLLSNEVKITNLYIYKTIWKTVIFQVELQKHRVTNFEQKHLKEKLVGLVLFSFTKVSCVVKSSFYTLLFIYRNIFFRKMQDVRKRSLSTKKRRLETICSRRSHPHTHHQLNRASNRKSQE